MALTLAEAFQNLQEVKQELAVWNELVDYLSQHVDWEVQPADKVITAEGCVVRHVPQDVIREIIQRLESDYVKPLMEKIQDLESVQVGETKRDKPKGPRQKGVGSLNRGGKAKTG